MRLQVDIDTFRQADYNKNLAIKQKAGAEAIEYCSNYIKLANVSDFLSNMTEEFTTLFKMQTKEVFNSMIPLEKQWELCEFKLHKLQAYQKQFESVKIQLNDKLEETEKPDFGVYIEGKRNIENYNNKLKLAKAIEAYQETGGDVKAALLMRGIPFAFQFDYNTQTLKPSL